MSGKFTNLTIAMSTKTVTSRVASAFTIFALMIGVAAPLFALPQPAYAAGIFSDGFESNNFSAWTLADSDWNIISDAYAGSRAAEVKDTGGSSDELRKDVSTVGYSAITLSYWYKIPAGLSSSDELYVQWYDGSTWQTIVNYDDTGTVANWVQATHVLPAGAANNANFRIQFSGDSLSASDKFRLDDVVLSGTALPPPNPAPIAVPDLYNVDEDTVLTVLAPGVLGNDTDNGPITAVLVVNVLFGVLTLNSDGSFSYTPNAHFNGADSFTYKAYDGTSDSNVVTASITVNPIADTPVANDDAYSTDEDVSVTTGNVLINDTDADGDTLSVLSSDVVSAQGGTVVDNADGTFGYTPAPGYFGNDTFSYTVTDGSLTDTAVVTINVSSVNDAPVAISDTYSTDEDIALVVVAPGVLTNDTDADSDPLTTLVVANPTDGTLTLNADGSFTYTPDTDFNGADSFTYRAYDGTVHSGVVTVTITVQAVGDAPVAVDDVASTNEDVAIAIPLATLLLNDTDADADLLSVTTVLNPVNGTVLISGSDAIFTPTPGFNGLASFEYTVSDGTNTDTGAVVVTVDSVLDACEDGIDNDGDTLIDFPDDPGCTSASDNDETHVVIPPPPANGECNDGIDNEGDTLIDQQDPQCYTNGVYTPTNTEASPVPTGGGGGITGLGGGGAVLGASTVGQVLGVSCGVYMDKYVRQGKRNSVDQVKKLQEFLNKHMNAGLPVTGYYGPLSAAAISAFQSKHADTILAPWGITTPTGIVYRTTLRQINMVECPDSAEGVPELVEWSKANDPKKPE